MALNPAFANPLYEGIMTDDAAFKEKVQSLLDKAVKLVYPKHVSYEQAIAAYDRYVELVGDKPWGIHREDLGVSGKEIGSLCKLVVAAWLLVHNLSTIFGFDPSALTTTGITAAMSAAVMHWCYGHGMNSTRRKIVDRAAEEEYYASQPEVVQEFSGTDFEEIMAAVKKALDK